MPKYRATTEDPVMGQFFDAASAYFKAPRERPKMPEIVEIYREAQIAFCLFTVDCESHIGAKRVSNFEIAEFAAKHDDICIPLPASTRTRAAWREARDLVENCGVKGFKFHHICRAARPQTRWPIHLRDHQPL
jgi:predicted TIM-barrel fold metal-dependent hydrolase